MGETMGSWQSLLPADRARLTLPSLKREDSCEEPTQVRFTCKGRAKHSLSGRLWPSGTWEKPTTKRIQFFQGRIAVQGSTNAGRRFVGGKSFRLTASG